MNELDRVVEQIQHLQAMLSQLQQTVQQIQQNRSSCGSSYNSYGNRLRSHGTGFVPSADRRDMPRQSEFSSYARYPYNLQ